ncbi:hypothetical protein MMSP_2792 [Mycobacterium sp. 012931]|nr:hypothetical protein MMSP_2792 [Mycobacterium sp. 012931]
MASGGQGVSVGPERDAPYGSVVAGQRLTQRTGLRWICDVP